MQATQSDERSGRQSTPAPARERASRRAIEKLVLSGHAAGARLAEVVRDRIADGSHRVVITNATRELPSDLVEHAFEALRYSGLVCAPDGDGDIALLGMCQPHDEIFATIPWGTSAALDELLRRAREQNISVMLLPPGRDSRR
jgi:glycosyltransferase A (GT-A) superfamily protein (DUF2064 family)